MIHDPRAARTERAFEQAMIKEMLEKPVGRISVTELCRIAGANRSTFYDHYLDVYDLFDRIEKRLIEKTVSTVVPFVPDSREQVRAIIGNMCSCMKAEKDLFLAVSNASGGNFTEKIVLSVMERMAGMSEYRWSFAGDLLGQKVALHYFFSGFFAIMHEWLQNSPTVSQEYIEDCLVILCTRGIAPDFLS